MNKPSIYTTPEDAEALRYRLIFWRTAAIALGIIVIILTATSR